LSTNSRPETVHVRTDIAVGASFASSGAMKTVVLDMPTFGFVVATRAALGAGLGLLLAGRMPESRRRTIGLTLVSIGAVTTIPAAMAVFRGRRNDIARLAS
jgi:hypothetical protein